MRFLLVVFLALLLAGVAALAFGLGALGKGFCFTPLADGALGAVFFFQVPDKGGVEGVVFTVPDPTLRFTTDGVEYPVTVGDAVTVPLARLGFTGLLGRGLYFLAITYSTSIG